MPQALSSFGHEVDSAKGPSFHLAVALGLAVIGAVIIVVQVCGYLSWLFSSDFAAIRSPVAVPEDIKAIVHQAELSSIIGASLWLCFVAWGWSRKRTLTQKGRPVRSIEGHEAVVAATRRGLRVDCKLSGLGYANFDPNSSAAVTVSREREI